MYSLSNFIVHTIIGFIMAFVGLLTPGLLTMTTLSVAIDRHKKQAVVFAAGVVLPIVIQAHIALLGAEYFKNHPEVIQSFSKIAVFVFWTLAIIFFRQYKQRHKIVTASKYKINNSFLYGVVVSTINPLAIPFYFTYSTLLEMQGILILQQPLVSFFVAGATLGAFSILYIYAINAEKLLGKIQFFAKRFKLILAMVMFILGLLSLINTLFSD